MRPRRSSVCERAHGAPSCSGLTRASPCRDSSGLRCASPENDGCGPLACPSPRRDDLHRAEARPAEAVGPVHVLDHGGGGNVAAGRDSPRDIGDRVGELVGLRARALEGRDIAVVARLRYELARPPASASRAPRPRRPRSGWRSRSRARPGRGRPAAAFRSATRRLGHRQRHDIALVLAQARGIGPLALHRVDHPLQPEALVQCRFGRARDARHGDHGLRAGRAGIGDGQRTSPPAPRPRACGRARPCGPCRRPSASCPRRPWPWPAPPAPSTSAPASRCSCSGRCCGCRRGSRRRG